MEGVESPEKIFVVSSTCACSDERAAELLTRADQDVKRAIKLHELQSRYRAITSPAGLQASSQKTLSPESQAESGRAATSDATHSHRQTPEQGTNPDLHRDETLSQSSNVAQQVTGWDFVLPVVPPQSTTLALSAGAAFETFNVRELVAWMQYGYSTNAVEQYLCRFDDGTVRKHINNDIEGFPAMFYVVETNKEDMLRLWVYHGGNVSVAHETSKAPLLAYAIMHGEDICSDTTLMTMTLLSLGASPAVIPSPFYSPYLQDLPDCGPSDENLQALTHEQKTWCTDATWAKLARSCSLSQRYYLDRAAKTKKPTRRQQQVAQRTRAEPLLGIANCLIGQTNTAKALLDTLLAHITEPGKKPLVLVFADPSGHGKTELARRLGHVLSLELNVVDCTIVNREMELFGPRPPYVGADKGSPLNNFLAKHHQQRCIVFLDEFEKTSHDIHKALLLPFENGEYQDRRSLDKIDCSKTIWILATNAHDAIIKDFSATNSVTLFSEENESEAKRLLKQLSYSIRDDFRSHHGAPIAGRISDFLPFLTFSVGEQAVIVHKALLELGRKVRQPVNLSGGPEEKLLGNVQLRIRRDATVCRTLAENEYHPDLGARSLNVAAEKIKQMLVCEYLKVDDEITEKGGISEFIIDVSGGEIIVNMVHSKRR
ncbi:hypothetical protein LTR56_000846 [Elasticomyces elasticus]|nr:hypothetical protein LTR22_018627 [Elasticomyces elasticus]KAK3660470.1 hypothetical protein LTR56_000846 [Elasticomyces elasticus]KAK4912272.1 hypothetical protein LTR49_019273 [Elasticomyces elasticus]KAK5751794.1 hypothetical protein LTS12_018122 [Elasticomyces elasticus]